MSWYSTFGYSLDVGLLTGFSVLHWVFGYSLGLRVITLPLPVPLVSIANAAGLSSCCTFEIFGDSVFNLNLPPQNCGIIDDCFFYFWLPRHRGIVLLVGFAFLGNFPPPASTGLLFVKAAERER